MNGSDFLKLSDETLARIGKPPEEKFKPATPTVDPVEEQLKKQIATLQYVLEGMKKEIETPKSVNNSFGEFGTRQVE